MNIDDHKKAINLMNSMEMIDAELAIVENALAELSGVNVAPLMQNPFREFFKFVDTTVEVLFCDAAILDLNQQKAELQAEFEAL